MEKTDLRSALDTTTYALLRCELGTFLVFDNSRVRNGYSIHWHPDPERVVTRAEGYEFPWIEPGQVFHRETVEEVESFTSFACEQTTKVWEAIQ